MKKGLLLFLSAVLLLTWSCSDNRSPEMMYDDAGDLYRDGKIHKAVKTYNKLTDTYPDNTLSVKATYKLAEIYAGDFQDYRSCINRYQYLADEYPSDPSAPKAR